ncbi:MAG: isoprenylcysteine carboxylmethyltransferase family protein [Clostridiales bacterium]|nr:isoprenylcysteine carboxylmethyltransferase family protein [Clostridiales bacterium]
MTKQLLIQAFFKTGSGAILMGLLLFLPAGTLCYPNAWLLLAILFLPMLVVGIVLMRKAPDLLRKRLNTKETESDQITVIIGSSAMFVSGFILAGLDFRFGWLPLPRWVSIAAAVVFLIAYALYVEVLRENAYLSRTVEIQENQKVIDTGLYGIVRHPLYSVTLLLFLSIPLVLGSLISLVVFLFYPILIAKRIRNEEQVLEDGLAGYSEYKTRVKYRMIPFLW